MKLLYLLTTLLIVGCATNQIPTYEAENIDEYIQQLEAQSNVVIASNTLSMYSWAGLGLFVAGVGTLAWTSKIKSGLYMIAGGSLLMSAVWIFNSEWFDWIVGGIALVIALDVSYIIYIKSKNYLSGKNAGQNQNND